MQGNTKFAIPYRDPYPYLLLLVVLADEIEHGFFLWLRSNKKANRRSPFFALGGC